MLSAQTAKRARWAKEGSITRTPLLIVLSVTFAIIPSLQGLPIDCPFTA